MTNMYIKNLEQNMSLIWIFNVQRGHNIKDIVEKK